MQIYIDYVLCMNYSFLYMNYLSPFVVCRWTICIIFYGRNNLYYLFCVRNNLYFFGMYLDYLWYFVFIILAIHEVDC
jgi:hypothetical protein